MGPSITRRAQDGVLFLSHWLVIVATWELGLTFAFRRAGFHDILPQTSRSRCIWKVLAPFVLYRTLPAKYRPVREGRIEGAMTTCFSRKYASETLNLRSPCKYVKIISLYSKVRSGNTWIIAQRARIKPKLRALNIASMFVASLTHDPHRLRGRYAFSAFTYLWRRPMALAISASISGPWTMSLRRTCIPYRA